MATILMGYERSTGTMKTGKQLVDKTTGELIEETVPYNNYIIHFVSSDRETVKGQYCDNVKASADRLQILGCSLDEMLGKEVILGYDVTAKADMNGRIRPMLTSIVCLTGGGKK